jgi:glycosyltransferase involved in cell wall biosynthesis
MNTSISVVIPVFNNDDTLEELHRRIHVALTVISDQFEIILVDDGSKDNSWQQITNLCSRDQRTVGLRLSRNFGQHPAIRAGLEYASGDLTILMDADLQDRPEEIPKLLRPFDGESTIEIVLTTYDFDTGRRSRFSSRLFNNAFTRATGDMVPQHGTFRAFSRKVREALLSYPERRAVYGPLMVQMGFERTFVHVTRSESPENRTSYTFRKRFVLAIDTLLSYSSAVPWVVSSLGFLLAAASAVFLIVIVVQYYAGTQDFFDGILFLIGLSVMMFGLVLLCIGILTTYVTRMFLEVISRPHFHIAQRTGDGLLGGLR